MTAVLAAKVRRSAVLAAKIKQDQSSRKGQTHGNFDEAAALKVAATEVAGDDCCSCSKIRAQPEQF
jgi:hypothetical protein